MSMYDLIEYRENYSETSVSLWQYYRDETLLANGAIADFSTDNNKSASFTRKFKYKFKTKIAGRVEDDGTKNVKIRVPLKYLSNVWRTLEIPFINCEINLILTWSNRRFTIYNPIAGQEPTFKITDTKLHVPVALLSTQDNAKLLEQLKSGFKRAINWNNYAAKVTVQQQNRYLDLLINPSFQGVNRLLVLSFENTDSRTSYTRYFLPLVERKSFNVVIDGRNFFDQPVKKNLTTYDNIRKIAAV